MSTLLSYKVSSAMEAYAASGAARKSSQMKYLICSENIVGLREIIANLTFVRLMKSHRTIEPEDETVMARAMDESVWGPMMAEYVSYTCYVNPAFPPEKFDLLFSASYAQYILHLRELMNNLATNLDHWKDSFSGALFI